MQIGTVKEAEARRYLKFCARIFIATAVMFFCFLLATYRSSNDLQVFFILGDEEGAREAEDSLMKIFRNKTAFLGEKAAWKTGRQLHERRRILRQMCARYKNNLSVHHTTFSLHRRFLMLEEFNILDCPVLKAGASYWFSIVAQLIRDEMTFRNGEFYRVHSLQDRFQPTKRQLRNISRYVDGWIIMLTTRDPFTRILSGYRNRIADTSHYTWQAWHWGPSILKYSRGQQIISRNIFHKNKTLKTLPSFKEFIDFIVNQHPSRLDPHWRPVHITCVPCHVDFQYILHTETLRKDLQFILRLSGSSEKVDWSITDSNSNKGQGNTTQLLKLYYETLGVDIMIKFLQLYKFDFLLFGYDPLHSLKVIFPSWNNKTLTNLFSIG